MKKLAFFVKARRGETGSRGFSQVRHTDTGIFPFSLLGLLVAAFLSFFFPFMLFDLFWSCLSVHLTYYLHCSF